jgi:hypothetical protein
MAISNQSESRHGIATCRAPPFSIWVFFANGDGCIDLHKNAPLFVSSCCTNLRFLVYLLGLAFGDFNCQTPLGQFIGFSK